MKRIAFALFMFYCLLLADSFAQAVPSGWTTHYRFRKYAQGANPGADSLNANVDAFDDNIYSGLRGQLTWDTTVTSQILRLYKYNDTTKAWLDIEGIPNTPEMRFRVRDNATHSSSIFTEIAAVSKGADSTLSYGRAKADGSFKIGARLPDGSGGLFDAAGIYRDSTIFYTAGTRRGKFDENGKFLEIKNINEIRYAENFSGVTAGAKIQAAIDDLPAAGGTVFLPASGNVATTIAINKPVRLIGNAVGTTLTRTANVDMFMVTANDVSIENCTLNGNRLVYTGGQSLWVIDSASRGNVYNVTFSSSPAIAVYGTNYASDWRVEDCYFIDNGTSAIFFENNSHRNVISRNYFTANHMLTSGHHAIVFHSTTASQSVDENIVEGNVIDKTGTGGFGVEIGAFGGNSPKRNIV